MKELCYDEFINANLLVEACGTGNKAVITNSLTNSVQAYTM